MTPNDIEVLIHCHTSLAPHPRLDAPAVYHAVQSFMSAGLIEVTHEHRVYTTTKRGKAHIIQLCCTKLPVQKWADEHGKIIGENTDGS